MKRLVSKFTIQQRRNQWRYKDALHNAHFGNVKQVMFQTLHITAGTDLSDVGF
jgi:hypothetical protein